MIALGGRARGDDDELPGLNDSTGRAYTETKHLDRKTYATVKSQ